MNEREIWTAAYIRVLGTVTRLGALISADEAAAYADKALAKWLEKFDQFAMRGAEVQPLQEPAAPAVETSTPPSE